jgi:hypothetical protein
MPNKWHKIIELNWQRFGFFIYPSLGKKLQIGFLKILQYEFSYNLRIQSLVNSHQNHLCVCHPTTWLHLIGIQSPKFKFLFEQGTTDIGWVVKFPRPSKKIK